MGMSEDIMKGGIPDDCNAWTKTGIVECLGTPDEHTDTFYRHGDWGIEEHNEHEFEVYAVVEGKPILVKEGFTTFRECTEFIRGSIASKRLETDVDEKDPENQTPKEEVKMVIKPFRMMMEDIMKANGEVDDIDPADVELNVRPDKFRTEDTIQSRPLGENGNINDKVVVPRNPNHKGLSYGGSPTGEVGGVDVGAGYPSHYNKHSKVIKDPNYKLSEGPTNPTRSVAGLNTHLEGTTGGGNINPDSDEREEILGEPALDALPPGTEVEGFDYKIKPDKGTKSSVYPTRTEKQTQFYEGEKPNYVSGYGLQAAQNYLTDALAEVIPEEIMIGTMQNPQVLIDAIKEQGTNGELAKQLRGFLANNPSFTAAWNDLSMGRKLVPGGDGISQHEQKSFTGEPQSYNSPEELIGDLRKLGKDSNTYRFVRNMLKNSASPTEIGSNKYIVPGADGKNTYLMKQFIMDNFDAVNDAIKGRSTELLQNATNDDPSLLSTGTVDETAGYSGVPKHDIPPRNSSPDGPGLLARDTWYPDSDWNGNADLTHETKNLMDAIYRLSREVFPNDRGGPTDQFYQVRNHGARDNKTSSVQWKNAAQVQQDIQNKFNNSERGKKLKEIYEMPHGEGEATYGEQVEYADASNAFYDAENKKIDEKRAKAAAKREDKKLKEESRHLANKQATEDRIQAKKDAEHQVAADRDEVSEEYNRIINEGARSWYQHMLDKGRGKGKGLDYYVEQYMTKFPRSNFTDMESLKALEAQIKGDADASHTKYTTKPGEVGQPRADRPAIPSKTMKVVKKGEEDYDDLDDAIPSFRDLVKAETDKVDATRGLPTGYRYKPETRVFRDLYRTTVIDGKDDISTVMPKTKD